MRADFILFLYYPVACRGSQFAIMIYLSVVIPAYNEEHRIEKTLEAVFEYLKKQNYKSEVLVVNDGSTDSTESRIKNQESRIKGIKNIKFWFLNNKINHGKGWAVRQGMLAANGKYILFADADNSTPIEQAEKLLKHIDQYEVIIGSRYIKGAKIEERQPLSRRLLSRAGNVLSQLILLPGIIDTQCGFKLFSREATQKIFSQQQADRWGFDMEILAIAKFLGYKVKETPVEWHNAEASKLRAAKAGSQALKDLLRVRLNLWKGVYKK